MKTEALIQYGIQQAIQNMRSDLDTLERNAQYIGISDVEDMLEVFKRFGDMMHELLNRRPPVKIAGLIHKDDLCGNE